MNFLARIIYYYIFILQNVPGHWMHRVQLWVSLTGFLGLWQAMIRTAALSSYFKPSLLPASLLLSAEISSVFEMECLHGHSSASREPVPLHAGELEDPSSCLTFPSTGEFPLKALKRAA